MAEHDEVVGSGAPRQRMGCGGKMLIWLVIVVVGVFVVAAVSETPEERARPTSEGAGSSAETDLDQWWFENQELFRLANDDFQAVALQGATTDPVALADSCYALAGSLESIQLNPPPEESVAEPLDAYLVEALAGATGCYEALDSNDDALLQLATARMTNANDLFPAFVEALAAEGISY